MSPNIGIGLETENDTWSHEMGEELDERVFTPAYRRTTKKWPIPGIRPVTGVFRKLFLQEGKRSG